MSKCTPCKCVIKNCPKLSKKLESDFYNLKFFHFMDGMDMVIYCTVMLSENFARGMANICEYLGCKYEITQTPVPPEYHNEFIRGGYGYVGWRRAYSLSDTSELWGFRELYIDSFDFHMAEITFRNTSLEKYTGKIKDIALHYGVYTKLKRWYNNIAVVHFYSASCTVDEFATAMYKLWQKSKSDSMFIKFRDHPQYQYFPNQSSRGHYLKPYIMRVDDMDIECRLLNRDPIYPLDVTADMI